MVTGVQAERNSGAATPAGGLSSGAAANALSTKASEHFDAIGITGVVGDHCRVFRIHHEVDPELGVFEIGRALRHGDIVHPARIALLRIDIFERRLLVPGAHGIAIPAHRDSRLAGNQQFLGFGIVAFDERLLLRQQVEHRLYILRVLVATRLAEIAQRHVDDVVDVAQHVDLALHRVIRLEEDFQ